MIISVFRSWSASGSLKEHSDGIIILTIDKIALKLKETRK